MFLKNKKTGFSFDLPEKECERIMKDSPFSYEIMDEIEEEEPKENVTKLTPTQAMAAEFGITIDPELGPLQASAFLVKELKEKAINAGKNIDGIKKAEDFAKLLRGGN